MPKTRNFKATVDARAQVDHDFAVALLAERDEEIERLSAESRKADDDFYKAQQCINQIDDLLEYSYTHYTVGGLRDKIMGFIDDYGVLMATVSTLRSKK